MYILASITTDPTELYSFSSSMGNLVGKVSLCSCKSEAGVISRRYDDHVGNSFCYVRPADSFHRCSSVSNSLSSDDDSIRYNTFRSISGASVSANTSTLSCTSPLDFPQCSSISDSSTSTERSASLTSYPLHRPYLATPGRVSDSRSDLMLSGFFSRPLVVDKSYSCHVRKGSDSLQLHKIISSNEFGIGRIPTGKNLMNVIRRAIYSNIYRWQRLIKAKMDLLGESKSVKNNNRESVTEEEENGDFDGNGELSKERQIFYSAQGKAGEDRVHVVISERYGWVFVGIYDGFNGPDATNFLQENLFLVVHSEVKDLLYEDQFDHKSFDATYQSSPQCDNQVGNRVDACDRLSSLDDEHTLEVETLRLVFDFDSTRNKVMISKNHRTKDYAEKLENKEMKGGISKDYQAKETMNSSHSSGAEIIRHSDILRALSKALRKTEDAFLECAEKVSIHNPELAMMGSCVLVVLMKGEDVYLMNVGDSRAVLAQNSDIRLGLDNYSEEWHGTNEETISVDSRVSRIGNLSCCQLTMDHNTHDLEEVQRIKKEHQADAGAVTNGRVKGCLNVTRAFGAGFLKQRKLNDELLEMFRVDYIGNSPYISCTPSLCHYKLNPRDRFLILSSDGLYQYMTNEEAVSLVESFMSSSPHEDPAQFLIQKVLARAVKKAGLELHELLDIPQGDRRRYHDDISIVIISLEGTELWRSFV